MSEKENRLKIMKEHFDNYDIYLSNPADSGNITTTSDTAAGSVWVAESNQPISFVYPTPLNNNKKGGDDMRYLYEVILVNPKNDAYYKDCIVARSETSALMKVYNKSTFEIDTENSDRVDFDDLKTSCRVLMEWIKEKSLKKAIETIKEAVE